MSGGMEITRAHWHPQLAEERIDRGARAGDELVGQAVLRAAEPRVPYATGELAESGEVRIEDGEVAVGYGAHHAVPLNAHPEWNYEGGRSGHWLEEALDEVAPEVGNLYAESIRVELGGEL